MLLGTLAATAWFAGPPIVHALHGRIDLAGSSVAWRSLSASAAAFLSAALWALAWKRQDFAYAIPAVLAAGVIVPAVVDSVEGREKSPRYRLYGFPSAGGGGAGVIISF